MTNKDNKTDEPQEASPLEQLAGEMRLRREALEAIRQFARRDEMHTSFFELDDLAVILDVDRRSLYRWVSDKDKKFLPSVSNAKSITNFVETMDACREVWTLVIEGWNMNPLRIFPPDAAVVGPKYLDLLTRPDFQKPERVEFLLMETARMIAGRFKKSKKAKGEENE